MQEPRKGKITQARKRKKGNAGALLKTINQLPFVSVHMNSGTDYKPLHHREQAKFTRAALMSYWHEKMFTCVRWGAAVRLPGKTM